MRLRCIALGLCLLLMGCSALLSYPDPVPETGSAFCSDGTDNDFNGKIDCEDSQCDGFCPEISETACKDGRDNDGDGMIDARDPRCFPVVSPSVQRCASNDATTFMESFDGTLSDQRWYAMGSFSSLTDLTKASTRQGRFDQVFLVNSVPSIAGIVTRSVFDGNWEELRLAFSAKVPAAWTATIALVPSSLAYENQPLLTGAQALMAITLNGCQDKTRITLTVPGQTAIAPFAAGQWTNIELKGSTDQFALVIDGKTGAGLPLNTKLAPSRIAMTVAPCTVGPNQTGQVEIDDLIMSLGGAMPCGFPSPQMPVLSSCRYQINQSTNFGVLTPTGLNLSVASEPEGMACGVVQSLNSGKTSAMSWTSTDHITWTAGGNLKASEDLAGTAVAWNPSSQKWRAITSELASDDQFLLYTFESADCVNWTQLDGKITLPPNTEAPSLLIPGLVYPEELYFSASPMMKTGRTLWRVNLAGGAPQQVTEFDKTLPVDPPISIARIGKNDIVATHVVSPSSGQTGLGLLVAMNDSLTEWKSAHPLTPALLDYRIDRAGFDRDGIVTGALLTADTTQLVYTGRGEPLYGARVSPELAPPTVGTAIMLPWGETLQRSAKTFAAGLTRQPDLCGNGTCESEESCQLCAIDCGVCSGRSILSDRFETGSAWTWYSTDGSQRVGGPYWNEKMGRITSGGLDVSTSSKEVGVDWIVRALSEPVSGDFELSFDFLMAASTNDTQQAFYVGLATSASVGQGGFVEFRRSGKTVAVRTVARVSGQTQTSQSQTLFIGDTTTRIFLSRKSGQLSVTALGIDQCPLSTTTLSVQYPSSDTLSTVAMGYDYRWSSLTGSSGNSFVDNLVLRVDQ